MTLFAPQGKAKSNGGAMLITERKSVAPRVLALGLSGCAHSAGCLILNIAARKDLISF
jgi:hypothetical protein